MNLNVIKQELLIARSEAEDEIAQIDRLLQIFGQSNGGERKKPVPAALRTKLEQDKTRSPSPRLVEEVVNTLVGAGRPLRNKEICDRLNRNSRTVARALTFLKKEGKVEYTRNKQNQIFWKWLA